MGIAILSSLGLSLVCVTATSVATDEPDFAMLRSAREDVRKNAQFICTYELRKVTVGSGSDPFDEGAEFSVIARGRHLVSGGQHLLTKDYEGGAVAIGEAADGSRTVVNSSWAVVWNEELELHFAPRENDMGNSVHPKTREEVEATSRGFRCFTCEEELGPVNLVEGCYGLWPGVPIPDPDFTLRERSDDRVTYGTSYQHSERLHIDVELTWRLDLEYPALELVSVKFRESVSGPVVTEQRSLASDWVPCGSMLLPRSVKYAIIDPESPAPPDVRWWISDDLREGEPHEFVFSFPVANDTTVFGLKKELPVVNGVRMLDLNAFSAADLMDDASNAHPITRNRNPRAPESSGGGFRWWILTGGTALLLLLLVVVSMKRRSHH